MVMDVNQTYCKNFANYTNMQSLKNILKCHLQQHERT